MASVYIQYEDITGTWNSCSNMEAPVSDTVLHQALKSMKQIKPHSRVRAVDEDGRLLDLWP